MGRWGNINVFARTETVPYKLYSTEFSANISTYFINETIIEGDGLLLNMNCVFP